MQSYIAFISYRHQPEDQAVARKLHRLIEHFHVPKELRRDGSKRLGRVFRDEDELPLSTDLGESIHYALGHSEYLIAICTPEYQKSRWCMEELNAFIASHGRDHVLAVLAAGTPEESFPPQLLTDTDADGNIRAVEPLAANIAAPTNAKRMKRLKTEHLRLAAAMPSACRFRMASRSFCAAKDRICRTRSAIKVPIRSFPFRVSSSGISMTQISIPISFASRCHCLRISS